MIGDSTQQMARSRGQNFDSDREATHSSPGMTSSALLHPHVGNAYFMDDIFKHAQRVYSEALREKHSDRCAPTHA